MSDEQDGYTSDNDSTTNPDTDDELEVAFDSARFIEVSDTEWCDDKIKSRVISCDTQITTKLTVQRVEYLTEIPWVWPIPRIPTAFLLDLRDPKFNIMNKDGSLYRPDALIKNKVCIISLFGFIMLKPFLRAKTLGKVHREALRALHRYGSCLEAYKSSVVGRDSNAADASHAPKLIQSFLM